MAFRIFRIHDDSSARDKKLIESVIELTKRQFPGEIESIINRIPRNMRDPVGKKFRSILFVATSNSDEVHGFALLYHSVKPEFCYLDYLATLPSRGGRGIGNALYSRVREECLILKTQGLFFECLPDDPKLSPDPVTRKENGKRLAFYEAYGARPIAGTEYETPVEEGYTDPPYLVFDPLEKKPELSGKYVQEVMLAILERKYSHMCSPEYIKKIIASVGDENVSLRAYKYSKVTAEQARLPVSLLSRITLIANVGHEIHHVRERGYVEAPIRIKAILKKLEASGLFELVSARPYPEKHIRAVHDADYVTYLKKVCAAIPEGESVYPYVFPIRNQKQKPDDLPVQAGYYCIDTFTPLSSSAYKAAVGAVNCALTGADTLLNGKRFAYALVRPPGHHAERRVFGGFCYFNSNAIAANYLSKYGKVAIIDVDYHHGNGQQDIFYTRKDVLTISIHGHPRFAYPYFTGFAKETGEGEGEGYNINMPLDENITVDVYMAALDRAIAKTKSFAPEYLVLAFGLDTAKGDPTGTWPLTQKDFDEIGKRISSLGLPTLVVQEGGYLTQTIGKNAMAFFKGLSYQVL